MRPVELNAKQQLIGGSNPNIFPWISDETSQNYMTVNGVLSPCHGKQANPTPLNGNVRTIYRSIFTGDVYIVSGSSIDRLDSTGAINYVGTINANESAVYFAENESDQMLIVDGTNAYVYNTKTGDFTKRPYDASAFPIKEPNCVKVINNIAFVSSSVTPEILPSNANDFNSFQADQIITFEGEPDLISSMAVINKNLYVVGQNHWERFVPTPGGSSLLTPSQILSGEYGLVSNKSFANKFKMAVGLFNNKQGSTQVRMLDGSNPDLQTISTPGVIRKILAQGSVYNADLYEIDGIRFYELSFKTMSFIYNFSSREWSYSTSPFDQVVYYNDIHYGARLAELYKVNYYENDQLKTRIIMPLNYNNKRMTISSCELFLYNKDLYNPTGPVKKIMMSWSKDSTIFSYTKEIEVNAKTYYQPVEFFPKIDCYQFCLKIETLENFQISDMNLKITLEGR